MTGSGRKGTCRTRVGRYSEPNRIYHVTTTTTQRAPIFARFEHGRTLVNSMRLQEDQGHARSLAFVVMPDHLHWLLQLTGSRSLSTVVNAAKSRSSRCINASIGSRRRLWQKGFHDRAIRRDEDLESIARYIIANPLRAGLVDSVARYPLWDAIWV